jgi:hypothetical protein
MASVFHQIQYWTWDIAPGRSLWLSYGPSDAYKKAVVQAMCCPSTQVGSTTVHGTQTIYTPIMYNTQTARVQGDIVFESCYAGFNLFNGGQNAIRYFSVQLSVIGP